jgi:hypothetical protein
MKDLLKDISELRGDELLATLLCLILIGAMAVLIIRFFIYAINFLLKKAK